MHLPKQPLFSVWDISKSELLEQFPTFFFDGFFVSYHQWLTPSHSLAQCLRDSSAINSDRHRHNPFPFLWKFSNVGRETMPLSHIARQSHISTVPSKFWLGRSTASVFLSYQCNIFLTAANAWESFCKSSKSHVSHGGHAGIFYVFSVLCSKASMKNWGSAFECPWCFQFK